MTRAEVRGLIQSAVSALSTSMRFNSGRITEFNSQRSNEYPYVWLEPLSVSTELTLTQTPLDTWECIIHVAKKDAPDSIPEQYEGVVDECDLIAQKLVYKINAVIDGYKLITMTNLSRQPFIHKHADDVSGVIISFSLSMIDSTNVC